MTRTKKQTGIVVYKQFSNKKTNQMWQLTGMAEQREINGEHTHLYHLVTPHLVR